LLANILFILFF